MREGNTRGLFEKRTVASLLTGEPEYMIPLGEETPEGWIVTGYPVGADHRAPHKAFIDAYRAKFNDTPRLGSFLGYSVGYMMRDLLEKAGSTDTEKLIATLKGDFKFTSVAGPVAIRALDQQSTMGAWVGETDQAGQGGRHEELEIRGRRQVLVPRSRGEGRAEGVRVRPPTRRWGSGCFCEVGGCPFSPWGEGARRADEGAFSVRRSKSPLTSSAK